MITGTTRGDRMRDCSTARPAKRPRVSPIDVPMAKTTEMVATRLAVLTLTHVALSQAGSLK